MVGTIMRRKTKMCGMYLEIRVTKWDEGKGFKGVITKGNYRYPVGLDVGHWIKSYWEPVVNNVIEVW